MAAVSKDGKETGASFTGCETERWSEVDWLHCRYPYFNQLQRHHFIEHSRSQVFVCHKKVQRKKVGADFDQVDVEECGGS